MIDERQALAWRIKDDAEDLQECVRQLVESLRRLGVTEDAEAAICAIRGLAINIDNDFYRWRRLPPKEAK